MFAVASNGEKSLTKQEYCCTSTEVANGNLGMHCMTDVAVAGAVQVAAAHSSDHNSSYPQETDNLAASNVGFDVEYSHGAEFIVRTGTPATVRLIFRDQKGAIIAGPTTGGKVINDSPVTFTATLSADGQAVLIVPKALGSTILRYFYCHCLTANLIVRVTNRIGPLRPHISVREIGARLSPSRGH